MQPEYHQFEEYQNRCRKLKEIRDCNIDPYPPKFTNTHSINYLIDKYVESHLAFDKAEQGATPQTTIAGRLVLFRSMGKNAFAHLQDDTGRIQVLFNRDHTSVAGLQKDSLPPIKFIEKKLDLGDIVGVAGHLFRTQKGELTIYVKTVTLLCKALLPLPDKHSGLADKGVRYRKRWLDLIAHPNVLRHFKMRSQIIEIIRNTLHSQQFREVETPILHHMYGGAQAKPFVSHLNALDQDMFLRISLEISLKKLLIGGLPRIYEMSKVFRNEGIDRTHNPEFTMLEMYAAYWDYEDVMEFTEKLFESIALELFGSPSIGTRKDKSGSAHEISLKTPWKRLTMKESIQTYANIDVDRTSDTQIKSLLKEKTDLPTQNIDSATRGQSIAYLFEELVEHHLIQPHHIIDHPVETTPLCKLHRDPKKREEGLVERFETFILGFEFCNAYSELNDPLVQRTLLEQQAEQKEAGDEEAHPLDEEFIEAICQGMPPAGGLGIGIDRLVMLFTGQDSIRDVLYFPLMRPEE